MTGETYPHLQHRAAPGAPLLFVFHGTGGDERQFFGLGRQILPDASVVSPRGDVSERGAARFFRREGEGRYDMADLARATDKMARFVAAKTEELQPSAVLALGYSNGANILAAMLLAGAARFDAAVLMHPLIPYEPAPVVLPGSPKLLITAGRHDPIGPAPLTERLGAMLRDGGAAVEFAWHPGGHELRDGEVAAASAFLAGAAGKNEGEAA